MARYRKVDTRIWNDEKFMALSDSGKLAFLFVMTNPHMTALGAMRATVPGLAMELHWPLPKFTRAFDEARRVGMVRRDQRAALVYLPNFLRYNPPESPNVVISWRDALDLLPECDLKRTMVERAEAFVRAYAEGLREGYTEAWSDAVAKAFEGALPNQEQEQEQEQEEDPPKAPRGGASGVEHVFNPAEIGWRAGEVWTAHLEAWRRFFKAENGVEPGLEPTLTPEIDEAIRRAVRIHDRKLLGPDQREQWKAESKARAAGIGIFLSDWHTGHNPKNDRRNGGKPYLEHWRPWKLQRGKGDPVDNFAELYFRERSRRAARG